MEKQISIIIPTCNMERYISQCLESLLIPNLSDVEILVINDGSKDRSSDIAHDYERRFPESIRVIDKPNGPVSYKLLCSIQLREILKRMAFIGHFVVMALGMP